MTSSIEPGGNDLARTVAAGRSRVFVGGQATSATPGNFGDFFVRAYSAETGSLLWQDHVVGAGIFGEVTGMTLDAGRVFAAGTVLKALTEEVVDQDWVVRAYNVKTGGVVWTDQMDKQGKIDIALDVIAHQGRVFTTGLGGDCPFFVDGNCDFLVRAYNGETGTLLWEDQFGVGGGEDFGQMLAVHGERVFATGFGGVGCVHDPVLTNCDFIVRAYDGGTGGVLWQDQFDLAGGDDAAFAVAAHGGRVFAAGYATTAAGDQDLLIRAYNDKDDEDDDDD